MVIGPRVMVIPLLMVIRRQLPKFYSWMLEVSKVESSEHQDNSNIDREPFPEPVSEEREIYGDYDGCHRRHV